MGKEKVRHSSDKKHCIKQWKFRMWDSNPRLTFRKKVALSAKLIRYLNRTDFTVCFGAGGGIRTPVGFPPNGFQDRLVMTASIRLHFFNSLFLLYST